MSAATAAAAAAAPTGPATVGVLAEFGSADALIAACKRVREAGYTKFDAHSPYPVHGIDDAIGITPTTLPYVVLGGGASGLTLGYLLQWWTAAIDYPIVISGKPMVGAHNVPICFELTILLGAFGAFFGMLLYNGLPQLYNPLFRSSRFRRATSDRMFVSIDAEDPKFDRVKTADFLRGLPGAAAVETVEEEETGPGAFPAPVVALAVVLACLAVVPPAIIGRARLQTTEYVGINRVLDKGMAFQPKYKPQSEGRLFGDGRTMRPAIPGTVAHVGEKFRDDLEWNTGLLPTGTGLRNGVGLVAGATGLTGVEKYTYTGRDVFDVLGLTTEADRRAALNRGRERFNIYCASCHGHAGDGNGLVHQKASAGENPAWVQPQVLNGSGANGAYVRGQANGRIFNTISYGRNSMRGLSHLIPVEDRWKIVAYMRALQLSRNATEADVPADKRAELRKATN
jgi:mono/diheme cytochrome c family protein